MRAGKKEAHSVVVQDLEAAIDTCQISVSCSHLMHPTEDLNSSIARDAPLPNLQWPISERREWFQRTGNVQRQPFGVAFSRVDTHEGR